MLWTNKYAPVSSKDLFHPSTSKVLEFIVGFRSQKKKAILLYGPPGSGKTSTIHAFAKERNLELIEVNASDFRNADKINEKVGNAVKQMSLFAKQKLILVDEVDGLAGNEDRGGISALIGLIKTTTFPIVCIANDAWNSKLSGLRKVCNLVDWSAPNYLSINKLLISILKKEGISFDDSVVKSIARRCGGDVRAAVTDLQCLVASSKLDAGGVNDIDERAHSDTMFDALIKILKSSDVSLALSAFDNVEEDINQRILWLEENLPLEYSGKDLCSAFDKLSKADVFFGRIRRWQHWRFLVYVNALISAGVAVSKTEKKPGFTKYQPPKRILKYWIAKQKKALRQSIAGKLASVSHCSSRKANEMLPYLKIFAEKGVDLSSLELDGVELDFLRKF